MYSSIFDLPSQVLSSLDPTDAETWMNVYNSSNPQTADEARNAKRLAWYACMKLPSSFSFTIIASTDTIDKAKDIIDLDSIKAHMDSFIDYGGNIQNDHGNYNVGVIWAWRPIKVKDGDKEVDAIEVNGNLFGGDLVYDNVRKAFVEGGLNNLSVAGEAAKGVYQCDERGCYTRRNVRQLLEISICTDPMNRLCKMKWYNDKARITKSASSLDFFVDGYVVHRDTSTCPILSLKKSLCDIGYDAHAKDDGVHIRMDSEEFAKSEHLFDEHDLWSAYDGKDAILNCRDENKLKDTFKQNLIKGYIDDYGFIMKTMPEDTFKMQYNMGMIKDCGYKFRMSRY